MSKITFSGSFTNVLPIGRNISREVKQEVSCIFCNYIVGEDKVCVIIPSEMWCEIIVTVNGLNVNLNEEYPNIINTVCRKARKMFPNWQG